MKYPIAIRTLLFALPVLPLSAFDIPFSTDFESDTIGQQPAGFSQLIDTDVAGNSLNVIAAESSFADGPDSTISVGSTGKALQWKDTSTTGSNPDIIVFDLPTGITQDVVIRFDFNNITGNNLRFQLHDDTNLSTSRGIRLDLDANGSIKNNGSSALADNGGSAQLGFTGTDKWTTIQITTNLANNTYDLIIQRDTSIVSTAYSALPFNHTISNIARWEFVDLGGTGSASEYYIDNLSADLVVVPEPSAYALVFGALSLGVVLLRRRQG